MRVRSVTVAVSAVLVLTGPMTACGGDSASPELNASVAAAGLGQARTYEDTASTDASLLVVSLRTTDGR